MDQINTEPRPTVLRTPASKLRSNKRITDRDKRLWDKHKETQVRKSR